MKKNLFVALFCALLFGCKSDDDNSNDPSSDLETLIIGDWDNLSNGLVNGLFCNGGYRFEENGIWRSEDFYDCDNPCGYIPYSGEYSIIGNSLHVTSGLGDLTGEITIENDILTIIRTDVEDTLVFKRLTCQ